MNQSLLSRFDVSDERIAAIQQQLQDKRDDARDQVRQFLTSLEVQTTEIAVRLQNQSLSAVYALSASTLSTTADLLDNVPLVSQSAATIRQRADALKAAQAPIGAPPIDDYDELNVGEVNDALDGLSTFALHKVRSYEAAHKDRVTVLREVDRRLS